MDTSISPDFEINNHGPISKAFMDRGICSFKHAATFISHLPYKRNKNKNDLLTVFSDECGTCGTKHALLKTLAKENNFKELRLMLGIFKMHAFNTPEVKETLRIYQLDYIPEAHNYLRFNGKLLDYTKPNFRLSLDLTDLMQEQDFEAEQIGDYKVHLLKDYHKKWLIDNDVIHLSADALWKIREQCIADLAKEN